MGNRRLVMSAAVSWATAVAVLAPAGMSSAGAVPAADPAPPSRAVTPSAVQVPGVAPGVRVVSGASRLIVSWGAAGPRGSRVLRYEVGDRRQVAGRWSAWSTLRAPASARSRAVPAVNGSRHQVRVRAVNAKGAGRWSPAITTTAGLPARVGGVSVQAAPAALRVTWATTSGNGSAVTAYRVAHRSRTGTTWSAWTTTTVAASARLRVIPGLVPGRPYAVTVTAVNRWGAGPSGGPVTGTPAAVPPPADTTPPGPVTALSIAATTTSSITLQWSNPVDDDLASLVVRRAAGSTAPATATSGTAVPLDVPLADVVTDDGLAASTTYSYAVFARDNAGNTSARAAVTATTDSGPPSDDTTPPGPVTSLTVGTRTTTSIALSWSNPADLDLAEVVVRRAQGSTAPATPAAGTAVVLSSPTATSLTDTGLAAGTTYSYAFFTRDTSANTRTTPTTVTTSTVPTALTITTTSLPAGVVGAPYLAILRAEPAAGVTWSITAGSLPAGLVLDGATGRIAGTPTGTAAAGITVRATAAAQPQQTRALTLTVTAATADWPQPRHDAGGRAWNGTDTVIDADNVAGLTEAYSLPGASGSAPQIAGTTAYLAGEVPDRDGTFAVSAIDLATGEVAWTGPLFPPGCQGGPVVVTTTAVLVQCNALLAYRRAAPHDLLWSTADTDPGITTQQVSVAGTSAVVWGSDRVLAYRLSDGQRLWQQLLPSGATGISDVVVDGTTVVVAYSDRLRALRLDTGAQLWSRTSTLYGFSGLTAAGGWVYTNTSGGVSRFSVATGDPGWTVLAASDIYQVLGADADTVYVWQAVFDFGPPAPSRIVALAAADGATRWSTDVPSRVRSFAVTSSLVWVASTDIYSQGRQSDLLALRRSTGEQVRRLTYDDNSYGSTAVANGYVLFPQGGSFGNGTPSLLRVLSLGAERPTVTTTMLPTARVGAAFSSTLAASGGTGPYTWSLTGGTWPAGLSLSSAGVVSGTPSAPASASVTVRVTDARGGTQSRALHVEVVGTVGSDWLTRSGGPDRTGWNPGETVVGLDSAAQLAFRWKTATPAGSTISEVSERQPVVIGTTLYDVDALGRLSAWSTTGSTTNRAPLWTVVAEGGGLDGSVNNYPDSPVAADGVLYLIDYAGQVDARSASTGARLWRKPLGALSSARNDLLVAGGKVLGLDNQFDLRALDAATGDPAWSGDAVALDGNELYGSRVLASDGTRVFVLAQCEVKAFAIADASPLWTVPVKEGGTTNCGSSAWVAPIVADGAVLAATYDGTIAVEAATGVVRWRSGTHPGYAAGSSVAASGVWVLPNGDNEDGSLVALDLRTGTVRWRNPTAPGAMRLAVAGDLVIGRTYYQLKGFSLLDGQEVWDGGAPEASARQSGAPAIAAGRIFVSTGEGTKAYGLP